MKNESWRARLADLVAKSGRGETELCTAAGLRHAWYGEMMGRPTDPKISYLLRFIAELGADPAYIFSGVDATPETLQLLRLLQSAPPAAQDAILSILRQLR